MLTLNQNINTISLKCDDYQVLVHDIMLKKIPFFDGYINYNNVKNGDIIDLTKNLNLVTENPSKSLKILITKNDHDSSGSMLS